MSFRRCRPIVLMCLCFVGVSAPACGQSVVYVVRHAEKASDVGDPPLSTTGVERSKALAEILKHANIKGIYTSEALRTKETAKPLATNTGIEATAVPGGDAHKTFERIRHNHPDEAVLIVGHSDTVGPLVRQWAMDAVITVGANEFDRLFVVVPQGSGKVSWVEFRYGTTTPQ